MTAAGLDDIRRPLFSPVLRLLALCLVGSGLLVLAVLVAFPGLFTGTSRQGVPPGREALADQVINSDPVCSNPLAETTFTVFDRHRIEWTCVGRALGKRFHGAGAVTCVDGEWRSTAGPLEYTGPRC